MSMPRCSLSLFRRCAGMGVLAWALGWAGCASDDGNAPGDSKSETPSHDRTQLVQVFPGLTFSSPLTVLPDPSDATRWFIAERSGQIWWVSTAAPTEKHHFGTVPGVNTDGEGGLLGMAFHPNYPAPADLFISYTLDGDTSGSPSNPLDSRVSRIDIAGGSLGAETILLELDQPYVNHNGGHIAFGPEGYLYIGFGDGGSAGDPEENGQDLTTLLGSLLRIDVDGGTPYAVPADNPFVGAGGGVLEEIYAYGLRNPWRFSFDRDTGALWLADVGQGAWEEVDVVEAGDNLGWNLMEGAHCYNTVTCSPDGLTLPIAEYSHSSGNCSVSGGHVYRGVALPAWNGLYFYADFCSGRIWTVPASGGLPLEVIDTPLQIAGFAEDGAGELYVLTLDVGAIYRIVSTP